MMNSEMLRAIREEVRRQLNIVLNAQAGENDSQTETINNLFPGMPGIDTRPVMHPYGFVSRAVAETTSVVVQVGADIHNRMTIGHRDPDRPDDLEEGESAIYSSAGRAFYMRNDKIQVGSGDADEPLVLGNVLIDFATELLTQLDAFIDAVKTGPIAVTTTPGNPAPTHPTLIAALTQIKAAVDEAKSTYISTASTNIISQENFTERGGDDA